jgi:hypothetical protein
LESGILTEQVTTIYILESLAFLFTISGFYFALKLFRFRIVKKSIERAGVIGLHSYLRWSIIRLVIIALPLWFDLLIYYWTINTNGGLLALIAATGTFFCWPSEKKMMQETMKSEDGEEEKEEYFNENKQP